MGHMDVERHTVTIFLTEGGKEVFPHSTEINTSIDRTLTFTDNSGKRQEFYGLAYSIAEE